MVAGLADNTRTFHTTGEVVGGDSAWGMLGRWKSQMPYNSPWLSSAYYAYAKKSSKLGASQPGSTVFT